MHIRFIDPPPGFFRVEFIEKKKSRYAQKYSFRCGLTQEELLCYHWEDDKDRMFEVRDDVASTPLLQFRVFPENPLKFGFYLNQFEDAGDLMFVLIGLGCLLNCILHLSAYLQMVRSLLK